jgi:hypothetical protein
LGRASFRDSNVAAPKVIAMEISQSGNGQFWSGHRHKPKSTGLTAFGIQYNGDFGDGPQPGKQRTQVAFAHAGGKISDIQLGIQLIRFVSAS